MNDNTQKENTMNFYANTLPGYQVYEYLLVLQPHLELKEKINSIKKSFAFSYDAASCTGGKHHLVIANFIQYEMMEPRLLNRLRITAMGYRPFKIELKDFGSYPSHSIFINVISKLPIQQLVKTIRKETQSLMKLNDENKPHFILEPQLTIARKLLPWQYEKGWLEYSAKTFSGKFIASNMMLLKRKVGTLPYQITEQFQFENKPVSTTQGALLF